MRWSKLLLIGILTALPLVGFAGVAHAQSFRTGTNTVVSSSETVDGTLFISGRSVEIAGTVNGDVFVAGQTVTVSGTVTGDVLGAGQTVRVSGRVDGDVRVAGQTVTIGATVGRNLSAAGQAVTVEGGGRVEGDASLAGTDVVINGSVGRDVMLGTNTATLNGRVGRNIQAGTDQLALGNEADIGGDVTYTSKRTVTRSSGAQVAGKVTRSEPAGKRESKQAEGFAWAFVLWLLTSMLLLAVVLVLLLPRLFQQATTDAVRNLGWVFLTGFVASLVLPIVIIGLMFTVIGIPLALLMLLVWLVLLMLSGPFAAYLLGYSILRNRTDNAIWYILTGGVILLLVYLIPVLGFLVLLVAHWFGLGMQLWQLRHVPKPRYHMVEAEATSALPSTQRSARRRSST